MNVNFKFPPRWLIGNSFQDPITLSSQSRLVSARRKFNERFYVLAFFPSRFIVNRTKPVRNVAQVATSSMLHYET